MRLFLSLVEDFLSKPRDEGFHRLGLALRCHYGGRYCGYGLVRTRLLRPRTPW